MPGLDLTRSEWAALLAVAFLVVRVAGAVGLVVWWYAADALRRPAPRPGLTLLTGVAVAVMCVAGLSVATGWRAGGARTVAFVAAAAGGFLLGMMFDTVVGIRLWAASNWLMAWRVPQYRERLLHTDAGVRLGAAERLKRLGLYARPARPELLAAARGDESADVRAAAAAAVLYSIPDPPDEGEDLAGELRPALADPDPRVRTAAAAVRVVFRAAPPAELLPALCGGLTSGDAETAAVAAEALGRLGPDAAPAIPDLTAAATAAENPNLVAPEALGRIGEAAVPALVEVLERGDPNCRAVAAEALGGMGPPARAALPALRKAVADADEVVAGAAGRAVKKLGGEIA